MIEKTILEKFYRKSSEDFKKIPSSPVAYWVSNDLLRSFEFSTPLKKLSFPRQGMATTNNSLFVRLWYEVSNVKSGFNYNSEQEAYHSGLKWFPYNKGGDYRKWYGNTINVVNYENNGNTICEYIDNTPGVKVKSNGRVINRDRYFKKSISWSKVSSGNIAFRFYPNGFIFDVAGCSIFSDKNTLLRYIGFLNSYVCRKILEAISPTLNFEVGHINSLPIISINDRKANILDEVITLLIRNSRFDWDSYETSWNFKNSPLLRKENNSLLIEKSYNDLRQQWLEMTKDMQQLEEQNNRIFIEAYGLQYELSPEVPLEEITLTCNPYYRYGGDKSEEELEDLLRADTMRELVSYAVGCIFGRYSLDKEGLILANAGDGIDEYLQQVPKPTFHPDESGILPLTEEDDFADDLPTQVRRFIRTAFGEEHFEQNIRFIEDALSKDLRSFLLKDLYKDHVKRYKKRPIYWMVSSPKGAFRALIYLHRYTPDTIGRLLNEYVRPFMKKLQNKIDNGQHQVNYGNLSKGEVTQLQKRIEKHRAELREITEWEKQVYDIAAKRIELDLDDGVKVNYQKLGTILEPIKGLNA